MRYTLFDVVPFLTTVRFRREVLGQVADRALHAWAADTYTALSHTLQPQIATPVTTKIGRFLVHEASRLSISRHRDRFVLKGAILFRLWSEPLHRPIRDLDLLGFGDAITPEPATVPYPTLLDLPTPMLRTYPRETVAAEKHQAMVVLGIANSGMKDFSDLWVLARTFDFDGAVLSRAIARTFARRRTPAPPNCCTYCCTWPLSGLSLGKKTGAWPRMREPLSMHAITREGATLGSLKLPTTDRESERETGFEPATLCLEGSAPLERPSRPC
jgi:hypothetical protein